MKQSWLRGASGARLAGDVCRVAFLVAVCVVISTGSWLSPTPTAEAKTPGKTYCFKRKCHRVKTIAETRRDIGKDQFVYASHYGDCRKDRYNPCGLTSSGERYRPHAADNAASPIYPDGTRLLVRNPRNGQTLVLRINNAGPYWGNRLLDVSRASARRLGFLRRGIARLQIRVLSAPTRAQARYRRLRRYAPVAGYVGKFASLDTAISLAGRRIAGLPPVPLSKLATLQQPVLQLADAEIGTRLTATRQLVALPARRPLPPLPVASLARSKSAAVRLASAAKRKSRRTRTARLANRSRAAKVRSAAQQRRKTEPKTAKRVRTAARLPANLRSKTGSKRKAVRVAALRTSSRVKAPRARAATVNAKPAPKRSADTQKTAVPAPKPRPRVSIIGHLGWRESIAAGQRQ